MELKKLVEIKNEKKAKKPKFLRQDAHKKDKLSDNWRQPKGKDSKMRKGFRGKRRQPSMGFSSPRLVRGFNREGFKERLVNNVSDLEGIDVSKEMVIVGAIGLKKKVEVMKKCQELKVKSSKVS
jgi:large subunit ribosomal protein L32e